MTVDERDGESAYDAAATRRLDGESFVDWGKRLQQRTHDQAVWENEERLRKLAEAQKLFEEAGAPFGMGATPSPASAPAPPPWVPAFSPGSSNDRGSAACAAPDGPDYMAIVGGLIPQLAALLSKKEDGGRRRDFQSYAFALMAGGKTWREAADLALDLLLVEDHAGRDAPPPVRLDETSLGCVGLEGSAG